MNHVTLLVSRQTPSLFKATGILALVICLTDAYPAGAQESSRDTTGWRETAWSKVALSRVPQQYVAENPVRYSSTIVTSDLPPQDSPDVQITTATNVTQSENSVAVSPLNDMLVLNSNNSSNYPVTQIFGADGFTSTNGGLTWTGSTAGVGGTNQGDPAAVIGVNGRFYVGYIRNSGQGCAYSTNNGSTWTHVQVAPNPGSLADKNHLTVDNSLSSSFVNNLYSVWTDFGGAHNNNIVASRSTDAGLTWSTRVNISSAVAAGSHNQGVNVQTGPNGDVYAVWAIYDAFPQDEPRLGFAKSTNGGATWGAAVRIGPTIKGIRNSLLLGGKNMRVNSFPSMAVNQQNGHIYVVWTNIGVPGVNTGTERDIYMMKSTNGGTTWGTAVRVNQDTFNNGKDQWFPWIACDPVTGNLGVIFYDSRDFASNDQANTYVAYSMDGGTSWQDFRVSDVSWSGDGSGTGFSGNYAGDYIGIAIRNNKVYPVWTDRRASGGRLSTWISPFTLAPSITVSIPNGGESWAIGSSQTVQWSSSGITGNVRIQLSRNGGSTFGETLFASTSNDGSESWMVTGPVSSTARVRISSVDDTTIVDTSNANFNIVQPTITVSVPNGGETWAIGSVQAIQWTSSNVSGNVMVELSTNGGSTFPTVLFASTPNDGDENWTVVGPVTALARIRISSLSLPGVTDMSNANFSIVQPTITVTSPNGGETWSVGSSQNVQWSSSNLTGNVRIELSTNGGATFPTVIASNTANDGSEAWVVAGPATTQARIRVSSVSIPSLADTSNANFAITEPSITIITPNGGDTWLVGVLRTISWTSMELAGPVQIQLSRNGGGSYETLIASTADDGLENWTVTGPATSTAVLRISSIGSPSVADISDGPFIISTSFSFLTNIIVSDNGGELDSLEFGTGAGATDGIDPSFGEFELPPVPPLGVFDARWRITGKQGSRRDIRDTLGGVQTQVIYRGMMQPGEAGHPFLLKWKPLELPAGTFILRDEVGGTSFVVNMKQQDSVLVADPEIVAFRIVYSSGNTVTANMEGGWNLVSLPVTVADQRTTAVFPTATSSAFAFTPAGYIIKDTLDYGVGYWLKFPSTQSVSVTGVSIAEDTIDVVQGWNMIGSISCAVPVGDIVQIPAGLLVSSVFGYGSAGYTISSSIEPMKGYWVKAGQNGQLVLSCPTVRSNQTVRE